MGIIYLVGLSIVAIGIGIGVISAPRNKPSKALYMAGSSAMVTIIVVVMAFSGASRSNSAGDWGTGLGSVLILLPLFLVLAGLTLGFLMGALKGAGDES